MRIGFALVLVTIAITTSFVEVNADENAKEDYLSATKSISVDSTPYYLKDAQAKIDKEVKLVFSEDEERVGVPGFSRLKSLLRKHPKQVRGNLGRTKNLDKIQASQGIQKLKSILGFSNKGQNKITPEKVKKVETYARDNPDKWEAMSDYISLAYWAVVGGVSIYVASLLLVAAIQESTP
ncbi:hypothetical protein F441_22420 [Phytophthora nicotianae CJ01A1]|uniref:Peptidyl-prolyl cis-trans isomerase n=3 Tax=Phytophthora nicotianae TaxID=4792 RepID=A0A0W8DIJ6_PHYNI|nr:hypothetical protein F441_22420 [Phytophthora nicotianae CJ01A1]KUF96198.1 Peptidyl-prolyl cis-trans isomerase [Phytophthora nicotianae]KUG01407.1 hypothetical protein AM587_10005015 [Phytophthora nicotianae]